MTEQNLVTEPDVGSQKQILPQEEESKEKASQHDDVKADFTFKMPTKLLSSTIGKSDTMSSNMLSYKFTKENLFYHEPGSAGVDRDGDEYLQQLKSLQDTMKSIREMDEEDRNRFAAKNWDEQTIKRQKGKPETARSSVQKSSASARLQQRSLRGLKYTASVDSVDYDLSSSDDEANVKLSARRQSSDIS